jgi:hypothetical protein
MPALNLRGRGSPDAILKLEITEQPKMGNFILAASMQFLDNNKNEIDF